MGLSKSIPHKSGINLTYHRIHKIEIGFTGKKSPEARFYMLSYIDHNAWLNSERGDSHLDGKQYVWENEWYPLAEKEQLKADNSVKKILYTQLKTMPEWSDASDVLESGQ